MLSRLDAIQDIRLGRGIQLSFKGHTHGDGRVSNFNVILRRDGKDGVVAAIDCHIMRKSYYINLTPKQVLAYIKRHYPQKCESGIRLQDTIPNLRIAHITTSPDMIGAVA